MAGAIDPVALNLLEIKGNQFGAGSDGAGYLFPTVPGTPGFTGPPGAASLNYGPLLLTDPGKFTDNQFTLNWDREFRGGKDRLSERFFCPIPTRSSLLGPIRSESRPVVSPA